MGFKIPDVVSLFNRTSPLSIGFPTFDMYLEAIPLVIIGYTLLFGDLITANEVLLDAQKSRPDEKLDINLNRSHLSIAARNFIGLILNPFSQPKVLYGLAFMWLLLSDGKKALKKCHLYLMAWAHII